MERLTRNDEVSRYELWLGNEIASIAEFEIDENTVRFPHTETALRFRGRGLAEELVLWALEDVRAQGRKALPMCSFVADVMQRHPEFAA
jgi:predicted GNAT family acetyltransferase